MEHSYITIPHWILAMDLDVYETIILAVIFGFSQDGESVFSGSQSYLARMAKCSRRKAITSLNHLVEIGIVEKLDKDVRGVKLCDYRVCTACIGCECGAQGYAPGAHHNYIDNEDINISSLSIKKAASKFVKPSQEEVAAYCAEKGYTLVDPEAFIAFYESKGWKVGGQSMKDWKSATTTWQKRAEKAVCGRRPAAAAKPSVYEQNARLAENIRKQNASSYGKRDYNPDEQ